MKNVKIDGRMAKVVVLKETDSHLVYIPLTHIDKVDYLRLIDIEAMGGEMLNNMRKTTLDNGRNALQQYDDVIQVMHYKQAGSTGIRMPKPEEGLRVQEKYQESIKQEEASSKKEEKDSKPAEETTAEAPKPKRRGRPPKNKPAEEQ